MSNGIIICGVNGSGKTTLGRELAKALNFIASRSMENIENWIKTLQCPVIKADGTNDIADNVKLISAKYCQILELK